MNYEVLSYQRKMIFFNPNILGQAQKVKICKKHTTDWSSN